MKKIVTGGNVSRTAQAAKARRAARTAKGRRAARGVAASRTAQTTLAAAIGAGVLLHGGPPAAGPAAPPAAYSLAASASMDDPSGDDRPAPPDDDVDRSSEPQDASTDDGNSEETSSVDAEEAEVDEPANTGERTGPVASESEHEPATQNPSRGAAPDRAAADETAGPATTSQTGGNAAITASSPATVEPSPSSAPAAHREPPPASTATGGVVEGRSERARKAPIVGSATEWSGDGLTFRSPSTATPTPSAPSSVARLALALLGLPTGSSSVTPGLPSPAGPSSALLVAQWALFRRGENPLFNRSPVAGTPTQSVSTSTGMVTGNLHVTDPDRDRLTYVVLPVDQPTHGTVTTAPDGTWTYRPDPTWAATGGTDTFVVTVRDNVPGSPGLGRYTERARRALAVHSPTLAGRLFGAHTIRVPVTVSITPTNKAPTPPATTPPPSVDPSTGAVTGRLGVIDPDGDALTYSGPTGSTSKGGTVLVDPLTGVYTYTPSAAARHAAAADGVGTSGRADTFTILVTDGRGAPVPVVVTVPISPTNATPSRTSTPLPEVDEVSGLVTGATGVTDDDGDALTYSGPTGPTPKGGTVTVDPATGAYTYRPSSSARHAAAATTASPEDAVATFTILVADGHGGIVPVVLTVPISPLNTPPGATATVPTQVDIVTGTVTGGLDVEDGDGDSLTYTGPTAPTGKGGTVTVDPATGAYTYTPSAAARHAAAATTAGDAARTDSFTVFVSDGHGATVPVTVTVPITGVNNGPVVPGTLPAPVVSSSGAVTGSLGVTDPDGDVLTYTGPTETTGKGATVTVDRATGRYTYRPSAAARHSAAAEGAGAGDRTDTFTIHVEDGFGASTPILVTVPISPLNTAPAGSTSPAPTLDEASGRVTGSTRAQDADGDTLTYAGPTGPTATGGTVTVDPATGGYTYTPSATARHAAARPGAPSAAKVDTFTVVVSDGHGGRVSVVHTVTVSPANAIPVAGTATAGAPDRATGAVNGNLGATDADGDVLTWTTTGKPSRGTVVVDAATGTYTYTPTGSARLTAATTGVPVTDTFTVTASDGYGGSVPVVVTVVVDPHVPATNTVLDTVSFDRNDFLTDVAFHPDGSRTYIVNLDGTVSVLTIADGTVTATVPVVSSPRGITISPDGTRAYVFSQSRGVSVFDTATDTVVNVLAVDGAVWEMLLDPSGQRLYLVASNRTTFEYRVVVIDTVTGETLYSPYLGSAARAMVLSPDGRRLSVLSIHGDAWVMSVLDASTSTLVSRTVLGGGSYGDLVISPDGSRAYAAEKNRGFVAVIDTATGRVMRQIDVGSDDGYTKDLALTADGRRLYFADGHRGTISVIDTTTSTVVATIPTGVPSTSPLSAITLSPDGRRAYVNNGAAGTVTVIDTVTNTVVATIPVGAGPGVVAVSADGTRVLVPSRSGAATIVYTGPGGSSQA